LTGPLSSLGWDEQFASEFLPYLTTHTPARVTRVDRGAADLVAEAGELRADITHRAPDVTVGDWAAVADGEIAAVLPRRTAIVRADASGRSAGQALVANIDHVLIAVPAVPSPRPGMVERLIALAWESGATPVVVLTKIDLSHDPYAVVDDLTASAPGCAVLAVSAVTDEGMDKLRCLDRPGGSLCLIGRSGAGKSTLANALLGIEEMAVTEVRIDGKGRHTTTHRQLLALPGGGVLIDTPGLRGVGMWTSDEGIDQTFPEIGELADRCRFSDCAHVSEPGCEVLAAVEDGRLPQRRLDSWRKLGREAEWIASRNDARLRKERQRAWRLLSAEVRRSGRIRP